MADSRKTFCLFFDVYFMLHKNKQDLSAIFFTFNDSDLYIYLLQQLRSCLNLRLKAMHLQKHKTARGGMQLHGLKSRALMSSMRDFIFFSYFLMNFYLLIQSAFYLQIIIADTSFYVCD